MTTPSGPIVFNANTGSDTQASGLGPVVAVYGSGGSTTATSAVVSGIDTTGVNVGDLLWVQSSSGRQFSVIASVDSISQVTCDDVFANTETVNWAIGGKRATWDNADSRQLFAYAFTFSNSQVVEVQTETDQTLSSTLTIYSTYNTYLTSPALSTIYTSGDFMAISVPQNSSIILKNLKFLSGSTGSTTPAIEGSGTKYMLECVIGEDGGSNNFMSGAMTGYGGYIYAHGCKFYGRGSSVGGTGFGHNNYHGHTVHLSSSLVKDFANATAQSRRTISVIGSIITNCNYGLWSSGAGGWYVVRDTIFHNISSDAIFWANLPLGSVLPPDLFYGCLFHSVSGHIVNSATGGGWSGFGGSKTDYDYPLLPSLYSYNSAWTFNNWPTMPVTTLALDPFIDADNGDFNLNNVATGGAVLRTAEHTL